MPVCVCLAWASQLHEVQQELQAMKRMRVSQQRALEKVKKEFRSKVLIKSREILSLRREANKERNLLRKLQTQEAKKVSGRVWAVASSIPPLM